MAYAAMKDILQLPLAERIEVAEAIWDSLADAVETEALLEPTEPERAELRRRLEEHDQQPSSAIAWEEVRRKLGAK
jgi:putative addiction module component (TIGR02574 family)